jgi:DNA repair exonuclease SbcCD ATPase subunit
MITVKNITIKNFMSVGNVTQAVQLDQNGLTLVLGNNLDLGGDGSRNGTGKTTLVNALCYGLYGQAITNIRKDNLVNKTNSKNMLVTIDFAKNGSTYRIERGRKPNVFKFIVNESEIADNASDEGQGENRLTQQHIESVLGMSYDMFKHILALNTFTEPFLSMKSTDQRAIIEQLLGITLLSEKAEILKELMKSSKDSLKEEEFRMKAQQESNNKIKSSIDDLEKRSSIWLRKSEEDIVNYQKIIADLESIEINQELANHQLVTAWKEKQSKITRFNKDVSTHQSAIKRLTTQRAELENALLKARDHTCHACGQGIHDSKQESMLSDLEDAVLIITTDITSESALEQVASSSITELGELGNCPILKYATLDEAINHKTTLDNTYNQLENKLLETDPYHEQIVHLKDTALTELDWDKINDLTKLIEHQDFLLKLLTNKDSFIRRKIIEQNLSYLNHRLEYYLEKLALPHEVKFQSDLTVTIEQLGQEFDFDNLSRGERNRLILGLSWSFRDVYESLNTPINLLFIDEMVDSGMDPNGVDSALGVLKKMSREQNKNIFLISHRDELIARVNTILQVTKENGFTTFGIDVDMVET